MNKREATHLEVPTNTSESDIEEKKGGSGVRGNGGSDRGAASGLRPPKIFGFPLAIANHVKAAIVPARNDGISNLKPKYKFVGPNPGVVKAEQNQTSAAASSLRPLRLFGIPIALARQIKATMVPATNEETSRLKPMFQFVGSDGPSSSTPDDSAPKIKFMGANPAAVKAQNQTSAAAGSMRPLGIFSMPLALARRAKSAMIVAPKVKFMGSNPAAAIKAGNLTNSASGALRPLRLFGLPLTFARGISAAIVAAPNSAHKLKPIFKFVGGRDLGAIEAENSPTGSVHKLEQELKLMGGNVAVIKDHDQTSGTSSMPRPVRPFSLPVALADYIKVRFASPTPEESANVVKFPGSVPVRNETKAQGLDSPEYESSASRNIRPHELFNLPVAVANHVKQAFSSSPNDNTPLNETRSPANATADSSVPGEDIVGHKGGRGGHPCCGSGGSGASTVRAPWIFKGAARLLRWF